MKDRRATKSTGTHNPFRFICQCENDRKAPPSYFIFGPGVSRISLRDFYVSAQIFLLLKYESNGPWYFYENWNVNKLLRLLEKVSVAEENLSVVVIYTSTTRYIKMFIDTDDSMKNGLLAFLLKYSCNLKSARNFNRIYKYLIDVALKNLISTIIKN